LIRESECQFRVRKGQRATENQRAWCVVKFQKMVTSRVTGPEEHTHIGRPVSDGLHDRRQTTLLEELPVLASVSLLE
jgi:hypothetical protein